MISSSLLKKLGSVGRIQLSYEIKLSYENKGKVNFRRRLQSVHLRFDDDVVSSSCVHFAAFCRMLFQHF